MAKPAFDPSKPFEVAQQSVGQAQSTAGAKPAFDPSAPFMPVKQAKAEKADSATVAGRNFVQGATLGFSDEFVGGVEAAGKAVGIDGLGGEFSGIKISDDGPTLDWEVLRDAYRKARDKERGNLKQDAKESPKLAIASNVVGSIASPVSKLKALQGASLMKSGAVVGGGAGLGLSESDLTEGDIGGALKDTATGVATGAVLGKGLQIGGAAVKSVANSKPVQATKKYLGEKAQNLAEAAAFKSSGAMLKDYRANDVKKLGRYMLDNKMVKPGSTVDDIAEAAGAKVDEAGVALDRVYTKANERFKETINKVGFDPKRDKGEILAAAKEELGDTVGADAAISKLSNYLDDVAARHGDKPNELALKKYQQEVQAYLPKLKNYMKQRTEYRQAVGRAADDPSQPVLGGLSDDLQRTTEKSRTIEVQGKPASAARISKADYSEQTFLAPLPQKQMGLFNPAQGDDLLPMAQKMELDRMSSGEIASLAKQAEMEGLDLVPRSYANVTDKAIGGAKGQTKMVLEPGQAPSRPLRPLEVRNPMAPRRTNDIKGAIDDEINYARNPLNKQPATEKAFKAARQAISKKVDESIDSLGGDWLVKELKMANADYGASKQIARMAGDRVNREAANKMFGLTDTITGSAAGVYGLTTGDWENALGAVVAKKAIEKYGVSTIATVADKVSKKLLSNPSGKQLMRVNPKAFQAIVFKHTKNTLGKMDSAQIAEGDRPSVRPLKGNEKWANDGFNKAIEAKPELSKFKGALLQDPKAKEILISMSDYTPGSKAFNSAMQQLESRLGKAN